MPKLSKIKNCSQNILIAISGSSIIYLQDIHTFDIFTIGHLLKHAAVTIVVLVFVFYILQVCREDDST